MNNDPTIGNLDGEEPTGSRPPGNPPLRIALVGAGSMARRHAVAIDRIGPQRAAIIGIVDPLPEARERLGALCPHARFFDSTEALLAELTPDVVHVCTPPASHTAIGLLAVGAGSHVYIEKPFAQTAQEASRLIEEASERGVKVCAGHQLLFEQPARRALSLLRAAGSLAHVESYFSFRPVRRAPGGGAPMPANEQLLDVLPHPVYLLLAVLEAAVPNGTSELAHVEIGESGTVHAVLKRGTLSGILVVTLVGRPIESTVRIVGTNGVIHADFVRGTVQTQLGPGVSSIDKVLSPYRLGRQLLTGSTRALARRVLKREKSYPGLVPLLEAFYESVRASAQLPLSAESIVVTTRVCEAIAEALSRNSSHVGTPLDEPRVAVTGGGGFLGARVVEHLLSQDSSVRVIARTARPPWEKRVGVDYVTADLSEPLSRQALDGIDTVIHCAAETTGGWTEHQRNSVDATRNTLKAAADAGVGLFIHVSSLAVLAPGRGKPLSDESPLERDGRSRGPYVWGKLESEQLAMRLGRELGLEVRVVRPGPLVDHERFEPPGALGRRIGNVFVAVGSGEDRIPVCDIGLCARVIGWIVGNALPAPPALNVLDPELPTRRSLLRELRDLNPGLRVVWLPRLFLNPLSWVAMGLQRVLRPGRSAINPARVFAVESYDTTRMKELVLDLAALAEPRARGKRDSRSRREGGGVRTATPAD